MLSDATRSQDLYTARAKTSCRPTTGPYTVETRSVETIDNDTTIATLLTLWLRTTR
jgi:hypothetical protein